MFEQRFANMCVKWNRDELSSTDHFRWPVSEVSYLQKQTVVENLFQNATNIFDCNLMIVKTQQ